MTISLRIKVFVVSKPNALELGLLDDRLLAVYRAFTPELDDELQRLGKVRAWSVHPQCDGHEHAENAAALSNPQRCGPAASLHGNRFPGMYDLEHVCGGAMGTTCNLKLYFGEPRKGPFGRSGLRGCGVLRGSIHRKAAAEVACGSQSELLSDRLALRRPSRIGALPREIGATTGMAWEH